MMQSRRISVVLDALEAKKITEAEADAYLRAYCATTLDEARNKTPVHHKYVLAATVLLIVVLSTFAYLFPGSIGLAILNIPQQNVTSGTYIPVTQNVSGLNISGALYGDGYATIYFDTAQGTYLVANVTSETNLPQTSQPSYNPGDQVNVINTPANASYYLDDGNSSTPVDLPFNAPSATSILLIVANDSGNLTTYKLPIIIGSAQRVVAFENVCIDTCAIPATNGTLRIETTNVTLQLSSVDAVVPNHAPVLAIQFPQLTIDKPTTLDLNTYFMDPDNDPLEYASGTNDIVNASINGSLLTIDPLQNGTGILMVYASDGQELVPAQIQFTVPNAESNTTTPEINTTTTVPNITPNITITENITNSTNASNSTNATFNATLNCSGANPNALPPECLLLHDVDYFPDQDIFWDNLDRVHVARFTIIGNLLLKGGVVENATGTPGSRDFVVGYPDRDGNTVPVVWIDTNTGNLYLKGSMIEENANLNPTPGSYSILTKRSVYLAYIDYNTGDLHIRGNVIPFRRSIE